MTAAAVLDVHASQRCFRALLDALANPGRLVELEGSEAVQVGAVLVVLALADVDTPIAVIGDDPLAAAVSEATRACLVPVDEARLVALVTPTAELLAQCPTGSAAFPEMGAKVGMSCDYLAVAPQIPGLMVSRSGEVALRLSGPGVDGEAVVFVGGVAPGVFEAMALANRDFPAGVDVWLVDGQGVVLGIPRSSTIEVV